MMMKILTWAVVGLVFYVPLHAKRRMVYQAPKVEKDQVAPSLKWQRNIGELNQKLLAHDYKVAFEQLTLWKKSEDEYSIWIVPVLESIGLLARFDDLGQKKDKKMAEKILLDLNERCEELESNSALQGQFYHFWCAMGGLQEGMIVGWSGLFKVRSSAKKLKALEELSDAQGMSAIYGYYSSAALSNMGLGDGGKADRLLLEKAFNQTLYFKSLLGLALGWVYYGEKKYDQTELLAKNILIDAPKNRIFRQMLGDSYKSQNLWGLAQKEYLTSELEYRKVAKGSVRHLSALGNLILISIALKSNDLMTWKKEYLKYINNVEGEMPASLLEELDDENAFE
jgi:hypothetical protein